jgi:hypothetical protein
MRLKDIAAIDIYTRWWRDTACGNPYHARKIVVNWGEETEKVFTVPMKYGSPNGVERDHIETLLGLPESCELSPASLYVIRNARFCRSRRIKYTYHDAVRVWKESGLAHPERFRNF